MNTIKFATKHFVINPTKNPDYFTVRAVDLSECKHYSAVVKHSVASQLAIHKGEAVGFTYSVGKVNNEYKCYLNRIDVDGGVLYDSYAEHKARSNA